MTETDQALRFAFAAPIFASPGVPDFRTPSFERLEWAPVRDSVLEAERLGYDSVWVSDHLFLGDQGAILESWTTLSAIASITSSIRLVNNHLSNEFRWAPLIAKMAGTVDLIADGRFELFLSPGTREREYPAYGYQLDDRATRVARLSEAVDVIRELWRGESVDFDGEFYHLLGAISRPAPALGAATPVWIAEGDDLTLDVIATKADGWNAFPAPLEQLAEKIERLQRACERAGRPMGELRKSLETQVLIVEDDAHWRGWLDTWTRLRGQYPTGPAMSDLVPSSPAPLDEAAFRSTFVVGTRAEVTERLAAYENLGFTDIVCWFLDFPGLESMRILASEIRPALAARPR